MQVYSRSVWFRQVDEALYELLSNILTYRDSHGVIVNVIPCFPKDTPDLKKVKLPTVVIKKTSSYFDLDRYDPNPVITKLSEGSHSATTEESAKPYTLKYQLDFLCKYQEDLDDISRIWLSRIPKRYMLDVFDTSGTPRQCYMVQTSPPISIGGSHTGDIPLYRLVVTYDIKVELDEGVENTTNIVTSVTFNQK